MALLKRNDQVRWKTSEKICCSLHHSENLQCFTSEDRFEISVPLYCRPSQHLYCRPSQHLNHYPHFCRSYSLSPSLTLLSSLSLLVSMSFITNPVYLVMNPLRRKVRETNLLLLWWSVQGRASKSSINVQEQDLGYEMSGQYIQWKKTY